MSRTLRDASGNVGEQVFPHAQLALEFDPALVHQHASLKECVAARIYTQRGGVTAVAGKLDMSPSHLCEVLGGGGERKRKFDLDELERYVEKFGDVTPILYLVAKFMPDAAANTQNAMQQLASIADLLPSLLAQAGVNRKARR